MSLGRMMSFPFIFGVLIFFLIQENSLSQTLFPELISDDLNCRLSLASTQIKIASDNYSYDDFNEGDADEGDQPDHYFTNVSKSVTPNLALQPFAGTVLFTETFDEAEDATTGADDTGGVSWTALAPGAVATTDYFKIVSGVLEAKDPNSPAATWTTGTINTTGFNSIDISMDLSESGQLENCSDCAGGSGIGCIDWVKLEYRIDGGTWLEVSEDNCPTLSEAPGNMIQIGNIAGGSEDYTTTISSGIGNTLELRISCVNWSGTELWRFDNIKVEGTVTLPPTIQIGSGTTTSSSNTITPWTTFFEDGRQQFLITASELSDLGLSNGDQLYSLAFNLTSDATPNSDVTISMKSTTDTEFSSFAFESAGFTEVYNGTHNPSIGWDRIIFDTPYTYDGNGIIVNFCINNSSFSGNSSVQYSTTGFNSHRYAYTDNTDGCTLSSFGRNTSRANIQFSTVAVSACVAPTAQATSAVFGTETSSTLALNSFTAPSGGADGYAVYISNTNSFTAPSNGDEPTADLSWNGAGQQPIYFGTSSSPNLTITGLDASTTYHFKVYAYNDCSGTETYETTGLGASDGSGGSSTSYVNLPSTENTPNNNQRGIMFNITTTNEITINSFDHTLAGSTPLTFEIYYKVGSFAGSESTSGDWTLVGSTSGLNPNNNNPTSTELTSIPIPIDLTIPAGQTYGFYLTFTSTLGFVTYSNGSSTNDLLANDANLEVRGGVAIDYPFILSANNRLSSVVVHYNTGGDPAVLSTLTSADAVNVLETSADLGGEVTSGGGFSGTERGVVYAVTATNANPQIGGTGVTKEANGAGIGVFNETVSGLTAGTQYSYAAFTTNGIGTAYGTVKTFTTTISAQEVNLSVSTNAGTEAAGTVITVTATAAAAVSGDQTIDLGVSGTGITGTDFTLSATSITILNGQTIGTVTFTVQDDADIEGDETATLTISNPSAGLTLGANTSENITITDDDGSSCSEVTAAVGLGSGTSSTISPFYAREFSGLSHSTRKQYIYTAAELNAAGIFGGEIRQFSFDFTSTSPTTFADIEIKMGSTTRSSWEDPDVDFITGLQTVVNTASYTLNSTGFKDFVLDTPFNWDGTSNLVIEFCSGTLIGGNGTDTFARVSVETTTDDMTLFLNQTNFTPGNACDATTGSRSSARPVIQIVSCETSVGVELSVSASTGTEVAGTAITVTATTAAAVSEDQTVDLGVSGTGITGSDYTLSASTITILDGATTGTVTFTVQDDADIEGDETATLTISNPSAGLNLGTTTTQNITITDDDFPAVELSVSANAGTEAAGTVITVTATAASAVSGDQTVDLGVSGTGITGTDYTLSGTTITILDGATTGTVTFTVLDDADIEGDETATLSISNPSAGLNLGTTTTQNITITDDDFPAVELSVSANAGTEAAGTAITVTATASQAVDGDQTVDLGVSGTGVTGTDYTLSGATITILDGATTGTATFTIQDDTDIEGDETATLTISNPSAGLNLGTTTTQNITITDDDFPAVELSVSANAGTEAAGTAITVTATAAQAVTGDQTVDLGVSGTGITGTDFTLSGTTITILDEATTGTVTFTVQDDANIEGDETATLTISNPSAGVSLGSTTTQNIAITDDDFPSVNLSVSANAGTEAAQTVVTVTATASQAVTGDQTVNIAASGTGITGTDYTLSGTTITILDGATTGTVTFTVQDDADIEGDETASLTISNPSAGLTLGTTTTQNIVIIDNDFPSIVYGGAGFTENMTNDGSVSGEITARLSGDSFNGPLVTNTDITLGNVPANLVPAISVQTGSADWTARTAAAQNSWRSVTYGNGQFVAVAFDGTNRVMTSPDGITWTARTAAAQNSWNSVTYGNGQFVAVAFDGTNRVMTSPDGITWTARTAAAQNIWQSVTYGNGQFVAVASSGTNRVMTSPDGVTWTARTAAEENIWNSVTYGNGQFVAVAQNGTNGVMTSPDGITWTAGTAAEENSWRSVTYGNGQFVAVASSGTNRVMTAADENIATLTLTGNATSHANANDVADITFNFANSAFAGGNAASVVNATGPASSSLGIDFDDPVAEEVNLSVSASTGTEAAGTIITVTATAASAVTGGDQTLDIAASGTGITGTDFTLSATSITILSGATTGTVTFTVQDDALVEGAETATLTISNPSAGVSLGATTTQNITITDDDFPTVELSVSANAGTEAAGTAITVTATAAQAVTGDQTIDLGVSGTGITVTDYTLSGTTITVLDGATTGTVTFTVQDDADIEGDETATLTISNPSAGVSLGSTTTQNITITDDDFPTVELSVSANAGTEAGTTAITVTATSSQAVDGDQTVDLGVSGTGITGTDYSLSGTSITILDGATTGIVTFTVQDDADIEGDETATLTISNPSTGVTLGSTTTQNIVITDDDFPTIELSVSANAGTEAAGTVITVTATASQAVDGNQTVDLGVSGTGITGTDYTLSGTTITILDGATTGTVTFTVQDDADIEGDETATLTISNPSAGVSLGTTTTQNITITDDDFPTVELSVSANAGTEAGTTAITVTATSSQAVDGDQTVDLGVSGTGITGTDYSLSGTSITILDGATTGIVTFTVQDDTDIEGDETATLTISNPSAGVSLGSTTTQNITITDDDFPSVDLSVSANVGTEAAGTVVTVTATASQAVTGDQTVNIAANGTGITGTDFTLSGTTITILNGQTTGTLTFTVQDDTDIEGDETATLNISNPSAGVSLGSTTTQNITITDDDIAGFTILESDGTSVVSESGTADVFTVVLNAQPVSDVVIDLSSADGGEVTVSPTSLTFTMVNWSTPQTITVTGVDDNLSDGDQVTLVTLTINDASSDDFYDAIIDQTVSVTTTDNDSAGFTIVESDGNTSVLESGTTDDFTVVLNSQPTSGVVIDLSSADVGEVTVSPSSLIFTSANWNMTQTVTLTGVDDNLIDGDQNTLITLTIDDGSSDDLFDVLADQTVNVTTVNDDFPTVELNVSANAGTEAAGTVITVTATASATVTGDQTVDLGVSGTGITNTDYALSGTTLTILSGATTGTVTFTVEDDALIEGTETATLTISSPSAGVSLGSTTTQNITITDDDFPSVEVSVSANAGTEAAGTVVTVTATASQAITGDQTIDLGVSGTGITGTDYTLSGTTITILDGATTGTVIFTIQDDGDIEGDETATLTISNPSAGLALGTTTTQNITITDNDFPTVELSVSANTGRETTSTAITVTVTASQSVDGDQTVDLLVSGTGITGTDYALSSTTITIFNGQTTGTVTFTVQDDFDVEGTETAILTISNPSAGMALGVTTTQNIAITDNDFYQVDLSVSASTGSEATGTVITATATASGTRNVNQTVDIGVSGTGITGTDYVLSNTTITIPSGQTTGAVTFTVQDDTDIEGTETATLALNNPSEGLSIGSSTQNIIITDNDVAGFTIVESDGSSVVSESGTTDGFTVVLDAQPVSDVVIDLSSADAGETTVSPASLTFTVANWNMPQTVTVTGVDDNLSDGDQVTLVTLTINDASSDDLYDAIIDQTVSVTTTDNDSAGFTISESDGTSVVSESGTVDNFTVVLNAQPAFDVVIDISSADINEVTVSPVNLTFTTANWNTPQTVTIAGIDDNVIDGDQTTLVTLTINDGSSDDAYDPLADQTVSVTTTDDDFPTVDLSVSANAGTEAAGTVITITATSSQAVTGDQTVDLGVSGTGITNTDFALSNATIIILNGQTTGTVTFTVQNDTDIEGDETATFTISNPSAGLTLGSTTTQNITITDNDFPTVELSVSANAGNEVAGTVITVTATTSQAVDGDQTVGLGVTGTGVTNTDFVLSNATITILNGQTTGTVTFTVLDDADVEGDETAILTISNPSAGLTLGTTTTQNITITDDDVAALPTVDLSVSANTGTEAAGTVITVTVTAASAVTGDQTVDLGISGTGITNTDYSLDNTTITILNGQTTGTVTFTVLDDADVEGTETATLTISNPSAGLTLGTTTTQNITITDDDMAANPTVELSVSANTGTEAAGSVITVTAAASSAVTGDQTIDLGISGTGITNTDYSLDNATITILNGQTTGTVTFTVLDDADVEGSETAMLTISNPSAGVTLGTTTTQNITITDDDMAANPTVELSVSANTGTEAAGSVITVTAAASSAVTGDQTIDLGISGTGITNTDYSLDNATITILNGQTTGTVTFTVLDDADVEGSETATLTISNPSAGLTLGTTTTQNITITDDDMAANPTVELSVSANTGTEAAGTVITVTATASSAVTGDQTIDLGISGTGITNTDYSLDNTTITILNGQTTGTVTFTVLDDTDVEGTETATLTISNPSAGVTLGTTTTQNITITDDDVAALPTVELSVSANAGTEAAGSVITVTVTASSAVTGDQTIDLGISGTGITNTDFMLSGTTITILSGQTTGTATFTVLDDADVEGSETATLTISNPSAGVTLGTTTTQNITITDDDMAANPTVDLSVSANAGTEAAGTVVTVTATASTAVTGDQTVDLGVSGTGITNTDYTLSGTTLTILNGQTTGTATFTVLDDADIEGDETATLTISNPSAGVTLGTTTSQNITITDNDVAANPTVDLSVSASAGTEAAQTVITVTATASAAVTGDQTVDLGVIGTGITNTDFALSNATITILNGQTTGAVTFTVQDDIDIEGDETATLTISNPSAGVTLGTTTTQNITITDNDVAANPTVDLSVSVSAGTEAAQTVITVTATASTAVTGDQTLGLGVTGTGITSTDFALSNTTITILDGATTGTVTFTVQDDTDIEGDETATLTISNPSAGVMLGTTTTQNIMITDNDVAANPTVGLSVSANAGTEAAGTAITVTVTASQSVDGDQTVDLGVSGTGITGTDYTLSGTTITILDGATTGTVTFTVQDDADIEGDETAMLTVSNPSAGLILGATTTQNITITDNDFPTVDLSVSANAGTEAAGTVITVTATASVAVTGDQTVDLGVTGNGITNTDFALSNATITILNGQTTGTATFTVQDDADIEGDETATLTISNPSAGITLGTTTTQNITITDNDFPTVELSVSANAGTEAAGTVITVTATASVAVTGDQTVDLGVTGNGITNTDFALSNATITILNGQTTGTATFTVQDDADIEGDETAMLTISNPSTGITLGTTTTQNITIPDNDFPTVELSVSANAGTEAAGTVITVTATASAAVTGDQTVDLGVSGTGITGTDYTLSGTTITILDGATTGTATFTVLDDTDIEGDETAMLSIGNPSSDLVLGTTVSQNITITDNDMGGFTMVETDGETAVSEAGTTDDFTIVLTNVPLTNVVMDISSADASEAVVNPVTVTFTPANWNIPQSVTVTGVDDITVDGDQTTQVNVSIDDSQSDDAFDLLADQMVSVITIDDDGITPDPTNTNTTIVASPSTLVADGVTVSNITIQLSDANGNPLIASGGAVTLAVSGTAMLSAVIDNADGTYSAMLTNIQAEIVTITGQLSGIDITDNEMVTFTPDLTDTDGDSVLDRMEDVNQNGDLEDDDTDRDAIPNYLDPDDDGDSLPTLEEDPNNDGDVKNDDTDEDGIPNYLDNDDDGDGILTLEEDANNNFDLFDDDTDNDGIINFLDPVENMVVDKLFSPNNDGINDVLQIRDIENFPNNVVKIFNRNGSLIYEIKGYNNRSTGWNGIPNRGFLTSGDKIVPNGTYFYVIEPNDGSETITGFFVLKR